MKNSELAERFANGATKGRGNNMFIKDRAIFSYGEHYCIAFRVNNNTYLFNTDKYSVTTSKHQSYVRSALMGETIIECNTQQIKRAIDYPDEPIIIEKTKISDDLDEILDMLKVYAKKEGLKRFNKKKFTEEIATKIRDMIIMEQL